MILTIGLIKADLVTAGQAIEYFEATSNKNIKNIAAYHLQQATEKLIKYTEPQPIQTIQSSIRIILKN